MENEATVRFNPYSEVYGVLLSLGNDFISKVPRNILENITNNIPYEKADNEKIYNVPKYDLKKSLKIQGLSKDATSIIYVLYKNYWCSSEKEKLYLEKVINNNDIKLEEKKKEKYNPDSLFKENIDTTKKNINSNEKILENSLVEVKEKSLFDKIIEKNIKSI